LEAAVALNRSGVITPGDLPAKLRGDAKDGERSEDFYTDLPSLEELEKRYLTHVLKVTGDNKLKAANILGIHRKTLYRMAERFKLWRRNPRDDGA
jgi:transcriptional regulator with PAS, ATPase and Fis domain